MTDPRVVFLGNDPWSVPALEVLATGPRPVLVLTRGPRPAGRGSTLRPTAVAEGALALGLPLLEVDTVRSGPGWDALREARPDIVAVVAYGEILPTEVLQLPPLGCVNLHFSLLPRWRGATPVRRAILAGDRVSGVTVMMLDEGLDTGPVLRTVEEPVLPDDDAGSLGDRLALLGAAALRDTIAALTAGDAAAVPQPAEGATYAPKLTAEERWIEWRADAEAIGLRVRAMAPTPGATTRFRGESIKLLRGRPLPPQGPADPGQVLGFDADGVVVSAGAGAYRIDEVAPAGRRRMDAGAWARGARFRPGERLG